MFRASTCPPSRGQIVLSQHMVSSLSVNGCTVCRMRADCRAENRRSKQRANRKEAVEIFPVICTFFVIFERSSCRACQEECTQCLVFCKKKIPWTSCFTKGCNLISVRILHIVFLFFFKIRYKVLHVISSSTFDFRKTFCTVKNALVGFISCVTEYTICIVVYIRVRCSAT